VIYDEEYDVCSYSTDDGKMKLMTTRNGCKNLLEISMDYNVYATSLCLAKNLQVLFVGTNIGSVRVFLWPIAINKQVPDAPPDFTEFYIHSDKVNNMEISYDGQCLISSSEDGTIFFSRIKEFFNGIEFNASSANIQNADPIKKKQYYQAQK
jgi:WD40 repeat protein